MLQILNMLYSFWQNFIYILLEMSPYLMIGFFIAGLLHVFIPSNIIFQFFGKNKFGSSLNAALVGVPLPLCSCGVLPTGLSLYKNGASKGSTLSFLISTPQTGIDSILVTYSLLGLPFAIIRPIAAFITGVFGGYIGNIAEPMQTNTQSEQKTESKHKTILQKIIAVFKYGFLDFMQDIAKWLFFGLILAATISAIIPNNFFETYNIPFLWQMLMMLALSIPLYICATASIPLATVLILKGLSPGAALILLMAGPATNMATITLIAKVMGKKSLLIYLSSIIAGAFIFASIINYLLPNKWFIIDANIEAHAHTSAFWIQITSGIILMCLIFYNLAKKCLFNNDTTIKSTKNMNIKTFEVKGMSCNHCKNNVERNLKKLDFVNEVHINLQKNEVQIEGDNIDEKVSADTINGLGYKFVDTISNE